MLCHFTTNSFPEIVYHVEHIHWKMLQCNVVFASIMMYFDRIELLVILNTAMKLSIIALLQDELSDKMFSRFHWVFPV